MSPFTRFRLWDDLFGTNLLAAGQAGPAGQTGPARKAQQARQGQQARHNIYKFTAQFKAEHEIPKPRINVLFCVFFFEKMTAKICLFSGKNLVRPAFAYVCVCVCVCVCEREREKGWLVGPVHVQCRIHQCAPSACPKKL